MILSCHFSYLDEPLEVFIVVSTVSGYYSLGSNQYRNWQVKIYHINDSHEKWFLIKSRKPDKVYHTNIFTDTVFCIKLYELAVEWFSASNTDINFHVYQACAVKNKTTNLKVIQSYIKTLFNKFNTVYLKLFTVYSKHCYSFTYFTVYHDHVTNTFQSESTLYSCLNVILLKIGTKSEFYVTVTGLEPTTTQFVLTKMVSLAKWLSVCLRAKWLLVQIPLLAFYLCQEVCIFAMLRTCVTVNLHIEVF